MFDADLELAVGGGVGVVVSFIVGDHLLCGAARGVSNPAFGDYATAVSFGMMSFGGPMTGLWCMHGYMLDGTTRVEDESGSGENYIGTTASGDVDDVGCLRASGVLVSVVSGAADEASDLLTMFDTGYRSLTCGSVCEVV